MLFALEPRFWCHRVPLPWVNACFGSMDVQSQCLGACQRMLGLRGAAGAVAMRSIPGFQGARCQWCRVVWCHEVSLAPGVLWFFPRHRRGTRTPSPWLAFLFASLFLCSLAKHQPFFFWVIFQEKPIPSEVVPVEDVALPARFGAVAVWSNAATPHAAHVRKESQGSGAVSDAIAESTIQVESELSYCCVLYCGAGMQW